ncbi:MAG TPA: serine/threonine protein kinase [Nannocystis exedens]|nr:serine/threonine protein kinase [Nannocystis exedens]
MRHPQMPTQPTHAPDEDDLDLEIDVDSTRSSPTMHDVGQARTGGARFTRAPSSARADGGRPQVRLLPGRQVPNTRYRLVRWLGEGGMGVVYEAEHEDIERRIALKILRREASDDPEQAARFREEARAASKIGSPNIVQIFDFGELPDGRLMFFMELLAGTGLDAEIETAPMDQSRLIAVLRQVCKGLAAAHDCGIVHRDIKPDNIILVSEGGRQDIAKIVDFGIATMLTAGNSSAPAAGTPQYMAPEQILGSAVDGRLDLYSLGCMAYELLTGHPPFHEGGVEELLEQQLTSQPTPLQDLVAPEDLHPALATVIMRCLAKQPEQRYSDARDLEAALCEAQIVAGLRTQWDDLPIPDVDPDRKALLISKMPSLVEPVDDRRRRWLWPLLVFVGMVLAASIAVVATREGPPKPGEEEAVLERERLALEAGARGNWVYPPTPGSNDTSYMHILVLESLEGPIAELGRDKGHELRGKFFDSLLALGDKWWDREEHSFAADAYSQAAVFAYDRDLAIILPDEEGAKRAKDRSGMTRGGMSGFLKDASKGSFTEGEVFGAQVVATLAEPDNEVREEKLKTLAKKPGKHALSATQLNRLTKFAKTNDLEKKPESKKPPVGDNVGEEPTESAGEEPSDSGSSDRNPNNNGVSNPKASKRNPKQSRKLSSKAAAALAAGQRKKAEGLFHQALSFDNRNAAALIGLSDIHFDRSNYQQAVQFATKAVQAAPKKASYRIRLGDAYFKLLRYQDALREYRAAKKLGSKGASDRISKVEARLGN